MASTKMADQVSSGDIKKRSRVLRELSRQKREAFHQQFLGQELSVLFEDEGEGMWNGLTDHYLRVDVRSSLNLKNTIQSVIATGVMSDRIVGLLTPRSDSVISPQHQERVMQGRTI